jgi:hypothetical protein
MKKQIMLVILGLLYWGCDIPFIPKFDWGQTPETTYWAHIQVLDFPSNQPIESAICVIPIQMDSYLSHTKNVQLKRKRFIILNFLAREIRQNMLK